MLKIRLQRYGRKNDPSFRVVVLESSEGPKTGNHVDQIGSYNAVTKQKTLNKERALHWLSVGAQPSPTVYNFFVSEGVIQGKKKNVLPKKTPIVKAPEAPVAANKPEPVVAETATSPNESPMADGSEVAEAAPVVDEPSEPAPAVEESVVA